MGNQANRDAIRAYMRENNVNYTTAKRALTGPTTPTMGNWATSSLMPLGVTAEGIRLGINPVDHAHTLITGEPASGKTVLASQIVWAAVERSDTVVVVAEKPSDYEWAPEEVRRNGIRSEEQDDGGGIVTSAVNLLAEVDREIDDRLSMPATETRGRLWVVVDGADGLVKQSSGAASDIERIIERITLLDGSAKVHLVLASSPWRGPAPTRFLDRIDNQVESLERGSALLCTPDHDGTKITVVLPWFG